VRVFIYCTATSRLGDPTQFSSKPSLYVTILRHMNQNSLIIYSLQVVSRLEARRFEEALFKDSIVTTAPSQSHFEPSPNLRTPTSHHFLYPLSCTASSLHLIITLALRSQDKIRDLVSVPPSPHSSLTPYPPPAQ